MSSTQIAIYAVTFIIAIAGLLDFIKDEVALRRQPRVDRPHLRKRFVQFIAVVGAVLLATLTWRLDRINDLREATLQRRLAEMREAQREMNAAANAVAQARIGIRAGVVTLQRLSSSSRIPDVRARTSELLSSVQADYEQALRHNYKEAQVRSAVELLGYYGLPTEMVDRPITLPLVVELIRRDQDLNRIACAFAAFSELTGSRVRMFDFAGVESWCVAPGARCAA